MVESMKRKQETNVTGVSPYELMLIIMAIVCIVPIAGKHLYKDSHLEWQGGDIINHAMMIYEEYHADVYGISEMQTYPHFSHWIAGKLVPYCDGEVVLAMRVAELGTIIMLLATQYYLIRRFATVDMSIIILASWQWLCILTKVQDFSANMCRLTALVDTFSAKRFRKTMLKTK